MLSHMSLLARASMVTLIITSTVTLTFRNSNNSFPVHNLPTPKFHENPPVTSSYPVHQQKTGGQNTIIARGK